MRKIAILGSSGPSNRWANDLPDDVELWAMNMGHRFLTRPAQRWFQMHHRMHNSDNGNPPGHFGRPLDHEEYLAGLTIPVYMQEIDSLIPASVRYPLESVTSTIGSYLTSTAAYMLALALHEYAMQDDIMSIKLLGIYMEQGEEYREQRPCMEYLLGVAKGLGVPVLLPPDCPLTKAPIYAYSEFQDPMETLQLREITLVT